MWKSSILMPPSNHSLSVMKQKGETRLCVWGSVLILRETIRAQGVGLIMFQHREVIWGLRTQWSDQRRMIKEADSPGQGPVTGTGQGPFRTIRFPESRSPRSAQVTNRSTGIFVTELNFLVASFVSAFYSYKKSDSTEGATLNCSPKHQCSRSLWSLLT